VLFDRQKDLADRANLEKEKKALTEKEKKEQKDEKKSDAKPGDKKPDDKAKPQSGAAVVGGAL
jgi:hypothetical protein